MAVPGSFDTIRRLSARAQHSLYSSPLLQASRAALGVALGFAAILLPAAIWRNIDALYAEFGPAVFVLVPAPLVMLILLYGRNADG